MEKRLIDWRRTGKNLQLLRNDNLALRKYVCKHLRYGTDECLYEGECNSCRFDMDANISRPELAKVFCVSESVIFNWETGKTPVTLEDMLFYCDIAQIDLKDVLVFEK